MLHAVWFRCGIPVKREVLYSFFKYCRFYRSRRALPEGECRNCDVTAVAVQYTALYISTVISPVYGSWNARCSTRDWMVSRSAKYVCRKGQHRWRLRRNSITPQHKVKILHGGLASRGPLSLSKLCDLITLLDCLWNLFLAKESICMFL